MARTRHTQPQPQQSPFEKLLTTKLSLKELLEGSERPGEFDSVVSIYVRKFALSSEQRKELNDSFTAKSPFKLLSELPKESPKQEQKEEQTTEKNS